MHYKHVNMDNKSLQNTLNPQHFIAVGGKLNISIFEFSFNSLQNNKKKKTIKTFSIVKNWKENMISMSCLSRKVEVKVIVLLFHGDFLITYQCKMADIIRDRWTIILRILQNREKSINETEQQNKEREITLLFYGKYL